MCESFLKWIFVWLFFFSSLFIQFKQFRNESSRCNHFIIREENPFKAYILKISLSDRHSEREQYFSYLAPIKKQHTSAHLMRYVPLSVKCVNYLRIYTFLCSHTERTSKCSSKRNKSKSKNTKTTTAAAAAKKYAYMPI